MADYEVGYGKPPKHTQFKKGVSGNPRGRMKGTSNISTALRRALSEPVVITVGGEKRTVSRMEAAVNRLVNKAAEGDINAFRLLSALEQSYQDPSEPRTTADLAEADQKLLQRLMQRFAGRSEV